MAEPPLPLLQLADLHPAASVVLKHADADGRAGLFRSCRAGRDWVLRCAPTLTLHLNTATDQCHTKWIAQLGRAKAFLITRMHRPTTLHVVCDDTAFTGSVLALITAQLQGATAGITQVAIESASILWPVNHRAAALFLQSAAAGMPHLASVRLQGCACVLPSPPALPSLRELVLVFPDNDEHAVRATCASVAQYTPQLHSIELRDPRNHWRDKDTLLPLIFTPEHPTHTLKSLSVTTDLCDSLLGLIVPHAPSITQLTVQCIRVSTAQYRSRDWGVTQLAVRAPECPLGSLANLPSSSMGAVVQVTVGCTGRKHGKLSLVLSEYQVSDSSTQRLPEFVFRVSAVELQATRGASLSHNTLRIKLQQITTLQAPGAVLSLGEFEWTEPLLEVLHSELACLPPLRWCVRVDTLTSRVLGAVLRLGERVQSLQAGNLDLQPYDHIHATWYWSELCIDACQTSDLLRLLSPATYKGRTSDEVPMLRCEKCNVDVASQVQIERLKAFFSHVIWAATTEKPRQPFENQPPPRHRIFQVGWSPNLPFTQQRLSILRSVRFCADAAEPPVTLELCAWALTKEVMGILRDLPAWPGVLDLCTCKWPLRPEQYAGLGEYVPTAFRSWWLGEHAAEGFVRAGAEGRRESEGLSRLEIIRHP